MGKNCYPGKFVVIEGIDGCGKTSQINLLVEFLKKKKKDVIVTKEPTEKSKAGKRIRQVLEGKLKMDPLELQKLYVQDRKEHLEREIVPALKKGKIVVCSRYFFSTLAYGSAEGIEMDLLMKMNKRFLLPDLVIILKASPSVCLERIKERGKKEEFFEKKEKLERVSKIYEKMPSLFKNVIIIDGEREIEEIFDEIKKIVQEKII